MKQSLVLGKKINLDDFMAVVRDHAVVEFSEEYKERVNRSRSLVERWVEEEKVMYRVTTGFGALCTRAISKEETAKLQENIILSHSVSVGEPLPEEAVRGTPADDAAESGTGGTAECVWKSWNWCGSC